MKSSARVGVVVLLVVVSGVLAAPALGGVKQSQVKEGIHTLQVGLQSYAIDHNDLYPRFISSAHFRALLYPAYVDNWPRNPNTDRPMRRARSAGNFGYRLSADRSRFLLIGRGKDGARIIVVP
jgi:hypothetical protein